MSFYANGLARDTFFYNSELYRITYFGLPLSRPLSSVPIAELREENVFIAVKVHMGKEKEEKKTTKQPEPVYYFCLNPNGPSSREGFVPAPASILEQIRAETAKLIKTGSIQRTPATTQLIGFALPAAETRPERLVKGTTLGGVLGHPGVVGGVVNFHNRVASILHAVAHFEPPEAFHTLAASNANAGLIKNVENMKKIPPQFWRGLLTMYSTLWFNTHQLLAVPLHQGTLPESLTLLKHIFGAEGALGQEDKTPPPPAAAAAAAIAAAAAQASGKEEKLEAPTVRITKHVRVGGLPGGPPVVQGVPSFHNRISALVHVMAHYKPPGSLEARYATEKNAHWLGEVKLIESRNAQWLQGYFFCYACLWNQTALLKTTPLPPSTDVREMQRIMRKVYGSDGVREKAEREKKMKEVESKLDAES